jgi:pyruvate dehydrogenase E1 component alpha subunit
MRDSAAFLLNLFRMMVRIRTFEESLVESILSGEIHTPCHLCSGQEAVAVGLCATLQKTDYIFGHHRSHGHFLAKGGSMKALAAEVYCREAGCSRGRGGSMHLVDTDSACWVRRPSWPGPSPGSRGRPGLFHQEGHPGDGELFRRRRHQRRGLYECLNFASLKKLPIIFACENNLYATHLPIREYRVDLEIAKIAEPWGIPTHCVDGTDVLQVLRCACRRFRHAAAAAGRCSWSQDLSPPGACGPDDNIQGFHTTSRPAEEIALWGRKDPIMNLERYLTQERWLKDTSSRPSGKRRPRRFSRPGPSQGEARIRTNKEMTRYVFA